jgi:hypothetical protein
MTRSTFDCAVARHGLSAVRQMSASGMPVLPENPVRLASCEANVSAPGEGITSRPLSGAAQVSVAVGDRPEGSKQLQVHREPINAAEPDGCDPVTLADDGRPQASGGAAPVITHSQSAAIPAETAPASRPSNPAGAVRLSDATLFILRLIAAHEGRPERDIVAQLIAAAGEAIGLSPLLTHAAGEIGDLSGLPNYARRAAKRCRGGVP